MIPIKQTIERRGTGFSAKEWREILKRAWDWAGKYWHKFILPKHFTRAGASEYNYKPRKKETEIRKARKFHHRRPLVFSGDLERAAKRVRDIRASSKGANIILKNLPRYVFQYRGDDPRKARELTAASERDAKAVAAVMDKQIQRDIDKGAKTIDLTRGHSTGTI